MFHFNYNKLWANLEMLHIEKLNCNLLGINIEAEEDESIIVNPFRLLLLFVGALAWIMAMAAHIIKNYNNLDDTAGSLTTITQSILSVVKFSLFLWQRRRFLALIKNICQMARKNNEAEREIWIAENQRQQFLARLYFSSILLSAICCIVTPLLLMLLRYLDKGDIVFLLSFRGIFPYDNSQPIYFFLTNILTFLMLGLVACSAVVTDSLFAWYIFNISAHMRIFNEKLKAFALSVTSSEENIMKHFHCSFLRIVRYHIAVIKFAKEFNDIYGPIIFAEVSFSCLQTCFIAFEMIAVHETSSLPFNVIAVCVISLQLVIYCFGGQKMQDESETICTDFYLSFHWELLSVKMKRLLLLPMLRTQHLTTLTGYFFTADRNLLVWIFRQTVSFTAVFFAVKQKQVVENVEL